MNEELFWQLIHKVHHAAPDDMQVKCEQISTELSKLSVEDAIEFQKLFDQQMDKTYTWPLWGAAYLIGGGCSDDAFYDFRSSLISRGAESVQAALLNPDSLSNKTIDEELMFYEGFQYAISQGVEAALGSIPVRYAPHPTDPSGETWNEDDDSLQKMLPNLWAKYQIQSDTEANSYIVVESPKKKDQVNLDFIYKLQLFGIAAIVILYVINKYLLNA